MNGLDDDGNGLVDDLTGFDFADSIDADRDGRFDGPDDVFDPDPFDERGHGTHVAGTAAAVADNGIGIVGVAPSARVMGVKAFPAVGSARASVLWQAVLYAAASGAHVINNSWSCGTPCPSNPLADEVLALVRAIGATVVTSAGNSSADVAFRAPENSAAVITVGALGQDERLADFSNFGWGLDLVAPGGGPHEPFSVRVARRNILSLLTSAIDPEAEVFSVDDGYWRLAGTSMSAPHVAGAIALLESHRPGLSSSQIRQLLRLTARDLGPPGHDPVYGAGVLDLAAVLAAPPLDLELRFDGPASGTIVDSSKGFVAIHGYATGTDLDRFELSVAKGLRGRLFSPLRVLDSAPEEIVEPEGGEDDSFGRGNSVLAYWDVSELDDGPYVVRLRGVLRDGRFVDEFLVLGLESATPISISRDANIVSAPTVSGRRVVWPVAEIGAPGIVYDLAGANFEHDRQKREVDEEEPPSDSQILLEREGSQTDVALDGRNLIWRVRDGPSSILEWCRLPRGPLRAASVSEAANESEPRTSACQAEAIAHDDGFVSAPHAKGGFFVWQRDEGMTRRIEGCRIGRRGDGCLPVPLVVEDGVRWSLRSFDGRTMLLQGGGRDALCRLGRSGTPCTPQEILRSVGTPTLTEPLHDGRMIVFREITVAFQAPRGCFPLEALPECAPVLAVLARLHACRLDDARICDSIPVSSRARVESFAGIAVEGDRVVWSQEGDAEEASLRFCEFEKETQTCVEQRLSGSLARQDLPAIDDNRLVWRDARSGPLAIYDYALPQIYGRRVHRLRAGEPFELRLRVDRGTSHGLEYEFDPLEGVVPALAHAKVHDPGRRGGRIRIRGVMPPDVTGRQRWRIRAVGENGLSSALVLTLEVSSDPSFEARREGVLRLAPE